MAIDMRRVAEAAIEAAVKEAITAPEPKKKKRGLSSGRALLLGAGLATAGRIAAGPKAREMFGRVRERITDANLFGEEPPDEDVDDEELEDEGDYEDEPDAEADDEFEPEDEFEEDDELEDEEEDEADEEPRARAR